MQLQINLNTKGCSINDVVFDFSKFWQAADLIPDLKGVGIQDVSEFRLKVFELLCQLKARLRFS